MKKAALFVTSALCAFAQPAFAQDAPQADDAVADEGEIYKQVAFNTPLQAAGTGSLAHQKEFGSATSFSSQLFSAFLGEPRTYGVTARFRF
jgi:hypothetical protein